MSRTEVIAVICFICVLIAGIYLIAVVWKRESDRSAVIMNVRNCQQAMRGDQSMEQLNVGDAFTRKDLEDYMKFPTGFGVFEGRIDFIPGAKVMPESSDPAVNGDHLWLKVKAPKTVDYVGRYGFEDIEDTTGW